jgi:ABC-type Co2+ transport system permease subunit
MKGHGIGLMRVEIELAALATLAAAVLAVLFQRLFNDTEGATPPLRHIVVSPARHKNKNAWPLARTNTQLRKFLLRFCF